MSAPSCLPESEVAVYNNAAAIPGADEKTLPDGRGPAARFEGELVDEDVGQRVDHDLADVDLPADGETRSGGCAIRSLLKALLPRLREFSSAPGIDVVRVECEEAPFRPITSTAGSQSTSFALRLHNLGSRGPLAGSSGRTRTVP